MAHDPQTPRQGFKRRTAGKPRRGPLRTELRTYLFNFAHMDTSNHDLILVAGKQRVKLEPVTPAVLKQVRQQHPILSNVPDHDLTHHVQDVALAAEAVQLCYVQRIARDRKDGRWDMALLFYHHPSSALLEAWKRGLARIERMRRLGRNFPQVPVKWLRYGITPAQRADLNDPVGEEVLQDTTSQAVALVAGHPELASGEPNSAADIQTNIIGTQASTQTLGEVITAQGPATTTGGWATQQPLINPDTGQPATNSQGDTQLLPVWSQATGQYAGQAISPALDTVKDDTTLGVNITTVDPTTITDNDPTTNGCIWTMHDGQPTVDQSLTTGLQAKQLTTGLQATKLTYQFTNQSPGHGYNLEIEGVGTNGSGTRTITFSAKNWFVRYLSLYVRYLDGSGNPIALTTIEPEIQSGFPLWDLGYNGTSDAFLDIVNPEFVFLGIPCKTADINKTIPVPKEAASVVILAGGIGSGDNSYPASLGPGVAMTASFNLGVPALMLSLMAAAGYGALVGELEGVGTLHEVLEVLVPVFEATFQIDLFDNPDKFIDMSVELGQFLLSSAGGYIDGLIAAAIAEGETIEAVEDAIPIVGAFFSALWAISLAATITETSAQVAQSPRTYIDTIAFTHDVAVTTAHDPNDPAGFPATATSFTVTALFDGGSPQTITQALHGTTVTTPITVTFHSVPAGGQVKVDVGFYSATGFLVGRGSVGPVANTATVSTLSLNITITELLVPLTTTTQYSHKEIVTLDSNGNHVWQSTTTPPAVVTPQGVCDNVSGHICTWTGITVSTVNAAVGYDWQAYNTNVHDSVNGAVGQLYQFANLSTTQNPQSSYLFSGCGFSGVVRVVYDLLGQPNWNFYLDPTNGNNYIRQIRLSAGGASSYDSPTSNKTFGRLQFSSDALLLHPLGKIISLNTALNKLEVLDLPAAAVADANAPLSQVRSGVGTRAGLLDGPIHAALTAQGTILVLEQQNNRIHAFDTGGNPVPYFDNGAYFVPLKDQIGAATYLDLAVEYSGYLYVLSYTGNGTSFVYRLDLYTPGGAWLARTTGVNADKLAVNYWRDLFTLNYQVLTLPSGALPNRTEPSVSHWIPSTP